VTWKRFAPPPLPRFQMAKEELPDGDRHEFAVRVRDAEGTYLFQAVLTFKADWLVPPPK